MNIQEYREVVNKTNMYTLSELDRFKLLTALAGEVGELCNMVKKMDRISDPSAIGLELGDILWYLTALANHFGYSLHAIMELNSDKVLRRHERGEIYKQRAEQ